MSGNSQLLEAAGQAGDGVGRNDIFALLPAFLADLPALLDDVADALAGADPVAAEFVHVARERVLVTAEVAIRRLVAGAAECSGARPAESEAVSDASWSDARTLFAELGSDHWRRGLPMPALLSVFRTGGRVGWRRMARLGVEHGLSQGGLVALGEAVFRLLDDICAAITTGYVGKQEAAAITRDRLRQALGERLLSDRADSAAVAAAAAAAGWALPTEAAVVLLPPGDDVGCDVLARMTPSCLVLRRPRPCAIVPDPRAPFARRRLLGALAGVPAVVGPTVPVDRLPDSARLAHLGMEILDPAASGEGPVVALEHLDAIIVHRDERLLGFLREQELRPLEGLAPRPREALQLTLRSWLLHMGSQRAIAEDLCVHPQTVRYRLSRLRELFGPALDDPELRARLVLALAWQGQPRRSRRPVASPRGVR